MLDVYTVLGSEYQDKQNLCLDNDEHVTCRSSILAGRSRQIILIYEKKKTSQSDILLGFFYRGFQGRIPCHQSYQKRCDLWL